MKHGKVVMALLAGIFLLSVVPQAFGQDDVIKKRKNIMRSNSKATKAIKKAGKSNDFATIEAKAKDIVAKMDKLLDVFPKGSTLGKTRAKPEIWEKWDAFDQKRLAVKTAAEELAKTAAAKDGEQLGAKIKALGTSGSGACGSCHKEFRKAKKRSKKK